MSFKQKVVLITEGSSGIGATTAKLFAKESAVVVIVGTDEAKLKVVAKSLVKLNAETLALVADVSKDEDTGDIVKTTVEKFGKLDVLVNNTGVLREAGFLADNFLESYDKVMNRMRGVVRLIYFAAPHLIKTQGNVINVSSVAGSSNTRPNIAYRASKAAMDNFTKSVALDLATHGVRMNTISPSLNCTAVSDSLKLQSEIFNNNTAQTKLSEPSEIADLILYVASNKGKGMTGSNFWRKLQLNDNKVSRHFVI